MKQETKEKVRSLLLKAELKEAIHLLLKSDLPRQTKQEVEILYSRLNGLERRSREGTLKDDDYTLETNKITKDFFLILDKDRFNRPAVSSVPSTTQNSYSKYLFLLVIPIILAFLYLPNLLSSEKIEVNEGKSNSDHSAEDTTETTVVDLPEKKPVEEPTDIVEEPAPPPPSNKTLTANAQTKTNKVTPKPSVEKLFNNKFTGSVAIVDLDKKNGTSNELNNFLEGKNFNSTTSFFRSNFLNKHQSALWQQNIEIIEDLALPQNFKCVCLLKEEVSYSKSKTFDNLTIANGKVKLKIINISKGDVTNLVIPIGGSGADERRAYESFKGNLTKEITLNNHQKQFAACKN